MTGQISSARAPTGGIQRIALPTVQQSRAFAFGRNGGALSRPFIPGSFRPGSFLRNPIYAHWPAFARAYFRGGFARFPWRHQLRSPGVIGWCGSLFWPYGYDDLLNYTFYPYAYDAFWPHAYDDVYDGLTRPYGWSVGSAYAATGGVLERRAAAATAGHVCSAEITGLPDWRISGIVHAMDLDNTQRAALDELGAATARALDILKAACPRDLPSTPTARLAAMRDRLAAMLAAVRLVRASLANFYNLLDDGQQARFNALGSEEENDPQMAREVAQICSAPVSGIAGIPLEQIERAVRPDATRRASLRHLADALTSAGNVLRSNCPGGNAITPVLRIDAMEQRLDAMLHAIEDLQPALNEFYDLLSPEQKVRFNLLAPTAG